MQTLTGPAACSGAQHLREQAAEERGALAQLAAGTALHLEPGGSYCLLPRPWLAAWRGFVTGAGTARRGGAAGPPGADLRRPGPLPAAVAETFCACHPSHGGPPPQPPARLNVLPPAVIRRCACMHCSCLLAHVPLALVQVHVTRP
jgi:hypothetical protein